MKLIEKRKENEWILPIGKDERPVDIELLFVGDIALARRVGENIDTYGIEYPFSRLTGSVLDGSDAFIFNLECCLSDKGDTWEPKPELMRGKPGYVEACRQIRSAKYIANVANNHFLDYGEMAARDTIDNIGERGMDHIGYVDKNKEKTPYTLNIKDTKICLLAFSPCAHPLPEESAINLENADKRNISAKVAEAANIADIVIVSLHQGIEYSRHVDKPSRDNSIAAVMAGADCVICHHTHVIQGVEKIDDKVIFHGLGNFMLDIHDSRRPAAEETIAVKMRIIDKKIDHFQIIPVRLNDKYQPCITSKNEAHRIITELNSLSSYLTTKTGRLFGYAHSNKIWLMSNIKSLFGMIQREGVYPTIKYYTVRTLAKLEAKLPI